MKIAVACGGTGGHIFPGLVTARTLRGRGHDVTLWLSGRSVEGQSLEGWEGDVRRVRSAGFQSRSPLAAAKAVWALARAANACARLMRSERPDVLLAMGSYASVGPVLAARRWRIPVVLHEANAVPGRAIGLLSRFAKVVAVGFPESAVRLPAGRTVFTGFPVREELSAMVRTPRGGGGPLRVLVMGGSQGAHALNVTGTEGVILASARGVGVRVTHLSGTVDVASVQAAYDAVGIEAGVWAFRRDMAQVYADADIALCRAGAATCAELAVCGVPALFVPLPSAARNHQEANARAVAAAGAADVILQRELTPARLAEALAGFATDERRLSRMAEAMSGLAVRDAAAHIANLVEEAA